MSAKPVQVSIEEDLLRRIDADPETRGAGRSAFIRSASRLYLEAKRRRSVDETIARVYGDKAGELLSEVEDLLGAQAWPAK